MTTDSASSADGADMYCQNCGREIEADASFCPECGTEITRSAAGSDEPPSPRWNRGLVAGVGLIVAAVVVAGVFSQTETAAGIFGLLFLGGWILLPVSMYYDTRYVRRTTGWSPNRMLWVAGTVVPYLNIVISLVYLYRRREHTADTSSAATIGTAARGGQAGGDRESPAAGRGTAAEDSRAASEPEPGAEPERGGEPQPDRSERGRSKPEPEPEPKPDTTTTARVSPEQIYTEGGTRYVETPIGPDKRLYTDSDGNHYYRRGQTMRALYGVLAFVAVAGAVFFIAFFPDAPGGPGAPRGRFLFSLVDAIPLGNVIVGIVAAWIAYQLASVAYQGREYVAIEDST